MQFHSWWNDWLDTYLRGWGFSGAADGCPTIRKNGIDIARINPDGSYTFIATPEQLRPALGYELATHTEAKLRRLRGIWHVQSPSGEIERYRIGLTINQHKMFCPEPVLDREEIRKTIATIAKTFVQKKKNDIKRYADGYTKNVVTSAQHDLERLEQRIQILTASLDAEDIPREGTWMVGTHEFTVLGEARQPLGPRLIIVQGLPEHPLMALSRWQFWEQARTKGWHKV